MFKFLVSFSFGLLMLVSADDLTSTVSISTGPIQGKLVDYRGIKVAEFLGIPYAKPPVESLRFQAPEKADTWNEVKSTVNYGPACPQRLERITLGKKSEDCLFLNVYVTESTLNSSSTRKRPVLFWIHGGGFTESSGNEFYDGVPMVPLHDIILVTHNYRLTAFGFIYFGESEPRIPSNIGLRDQLLALKWVKENIAKFGGDPNQVTIFGESAGSISVSVHLLSPLSKGLFKRAILESGSIYKPSHKRDLSFDNAWSVLNKTSCASTKDILGCLQNLSLSEIVDNLSPELGQFRWTDGDDFLPYGAVEAFSQGLYDDSIDLLVGAENNEKSIFMTKLDPELFDPVAPAPLDYQTALGFLSRIFKQDKLDYFRELYFGPPTNDSDFLRLQLERAYSDNSLFCPTYIFGLQYGSNNQNGRVYAYYHTQKPKAIRIFPACDISTWMGTCHTAEIPHVFGQPLVDPNGTKDDIDLSIEMMKIWTHFAEFGKPPKVNGTEWKTLNEDRSAMIMNVNNLGAVERERIQFCIKQWNNFGL